MDRFYFGVACRRLISASALIVWVIFPFDGPAVEAQEKASRCEIKITAPSPGDKVGKEGEVQGKAKIPVGNYLWVFVHLKQLREKWWPQGGGSAYIDEDGTWEVVAGYGGPQDKGKPFEIALAVVNEQVNTQLRRWVQRGEQTDKYPPIEFPNVIDGCPPVKITVTKTE